MGTWSPIPVTSGRYRGDPAEMRSRRGWNVTVHLTGKIVDLTTLAATDVNALMAAAAESRASYVHAHVPIDTAGMEHWATQALAAAEAGRQRPFVIRWAATGVAIGTTSFHMEKWPWPASQPNVPDAVEIGSTWLAHSAQRTGANREAKLMMLTHAFGHWAVQRVRFRTDVRNNRSRQAIEGLGAQFDGILRGDFSGADGTVRDSAYYSILAAEWPIIRERLSAARQTIS